VAAKPFGRVLFSPASGIVSYISPFHLAWIAREAGNPCNFSALTAEPQDACGCCGPDAALNDTFKPIRASSPSCLAWRTRRIWMTGDVLRRRR
jgi:hypothetical protein